MTSKVLRLFVCGCAASVLSACSGPPVEQIAGENSPALAAPASPTTNSAPTISGLPPTSIDVGQLYAFRPTASDADSDRLAFSIANKPAWAAFETDTGRLSGTPTAADVGDFANIAITVSDGKATANLAPFAIRVIAVTATTPTSAAPTNTPVVAPAPPVSAPPTPTTGATPSTGNPSAATPATSSQTPAPDPALVNHGPAVSGTPPATAIAGSAYAFTPSASDIDGDPLTFAISNRPAWAAFDTRSGRLSGTPSSADAGTYRDILIAVSDGKLSSGLPAFSIEVTVPNRVPTIAGTPATSVAAGASYDFKPTATDADGDPLTFSIDNKPAWANFDSATGRLWGTPGAGVASDTQGIVIRVSDGKLSAALPAFSIAITAANRAPSIAGRPQATTSANSSYDFLPVASDPDGDRLVFAIDNRPGWVSFDVGTGRLAGTPAVTDVGTYGNIVIRVSDGALSAALPGFFISVTAPSAGANRAPTIGGTPAATVAAGNDYDFTPTAADPEGARLSFGITNKPAWAVFDTSTGRLSGTPTVADAGTYGNIIIRVSDGSANATLAPFSITVTAVNHAPLISGTPLTTATVGSAYSFTPNASDPDGDPLAFSIANKPAWASFDSASGRLSGTPTTGDIGTASNVSIRVSDGSVTSSLAGFSIDVNAADSGPGEVRWASPSGTGNCFEVSPCSLSVALQAGATVVLKDGTYSGIGWNGSSEPIRIPSGTASAPTVVRAQNAGGAVINGLWIGRSTRKDSNIRIEGVRVEGGVQLYNTQRVTLKNVGVHGSLDVGTNDHDQGNTDNLIEDVWVWASGQRIIAINYRADRNVWRRVVVRGDGCGTSACSGSGNPNVGITIYDSADVSFQNVMVIDRVLAGSDSPYSDFACAQHTAGQYLWGRNEWLGIVSINAPDQSLYCEPDNVIPGATSATIRDALLWNGGGLNLARQGRFDVSRVWTKARSDDAFRVAPELAGSGSTVSNVVATGTGRYGLNTSVGASNVNVSGTWSGGAYNQTGCVSNCSTSMPSFAPTAYLVRYGTDGARFGEAGYNASQGASPLPWPNEARIKAEMCASTSRGFCSASSLSSYLSTQLR